MPNLCFVNDDYTMRATTNGAAYGRRQQQGMVVRWIIRVAYTDANYSQVHSYRHESWPVVGGSNEYDGNIGMGSRIGDDAALN